MSLQLPFHQRFCYSPGQAGVGCVVLDTAIPPQPGGILEGEKGMSGNCKLLESTTKPIRFKWTVFFPAFLLRWYAALQC